MTTPGNAGRFDGYDVLGVAEHWDPVTREVVLRRLAPADRLQFFSDAEGACARALLDRLLGQDHADGSPYIDVLADIDARLADGNTDGWHYVDMPQDDEAWRKSIQYLDNDGRARFGSDFVALTCAQQMAVVQGVQARIGASWHNLPAAHVWSLWTRYACAAFYAHPWAWNEIGFGGPAYPRGYKNIGPDRREPWEKPERGAVDPVPWVQRTERARHEHLERMRAAR